ncbi:MAG: FHA domain-containing protein [Kiritimatiellae bacterium]|nr:FHA domain-containing protein [Kiritimatiellia bacterium]
MAERPELIIVSGELAGRRFSVGEGGLRLGRSSSNDIHVPDEGLSRNHCLFETSGESGLRVTDLASANGTFVNDVQIGVDPVELKEGDIIEVGDVKVRVGVSSAASAQPAASAAPAPVGKVDLGLGGSASGGGGSAAAQQRRRSPLANALWAVAVLAALGAIAVVLLVPADRDAPPAPAPVADEKPVLRELFYERVKADSRGIYRYALTLSEDGALSVKIDDTSNNRRMAPKRKSLSAEALAELGEVLSWDAMKDFDSSYSGVEPDPPALDGITLKAVYSTCAKTVRVANTQEPDELAAMREKLEAFSKSELGVWAIAYPREKLVELAEQAVSLGDAKWEDRDVNYGNLAASIAAYQEALFYLETVSPKPDCARAAADGLARSKEELQRRYTDQRFLADKALNLSRWEVARDELKVLLEMVPDRRDDRNRDARAKLMSAENNLKKRGAK